MRPAFKLYPEERHWWSFEDYGAVLDVMQRLTPARVLEFGPGSSTLALIEGGATHIDTCEDAPDWADVYAERLERKYPDIVHLHRYDWVDPLTIPSIDDERYDLALIDGPRGTDQRAVVVRYALERCRAVLVPTEDGNPRVRQALHAIAFEKGWHLVIAEMGPPTGGFALLTRPDPTTHVTVAAVEDSMQADGVNAAPDDPSPPVLLPRWRKRGPRKPVKEKA